MRLLRVGHNWATSLSLFTFMHWRRKWQPTPVFLLGESQGRGSLVGCRLWGRRVGHDWSDLATAAAAAETFQCAQWKIKHWAPLIAPTLGWGIVLRLLESNRYLPSRVCLRRKWTWKCLVCVFFPPILCGFGILVPPTRDRTWALALKAPES